MNTKTLWYIIKRIGLSLLTVLIVITITFFVMHAVPGGPFLGEKAISEAAKAALEAAEILTYKQCVDLNITVDYSLYDKITTLCQNKNGKIIDTQFTDNVNITIRMLSGTQDELISDLVVMTKGKEPTVSEEIYDIF